MYTRKTGVGHGQTGNGQGQGLIRVKAHSQVILAGDKQGCGDKQSWLFTCSEDTCGEKQFALAVTSLYKGWCNIQCEEGNDLVSDIESLQQQYRECLAFGIQACKEAWFTLAYQGGLG